MSGYVEVVDDHGNTQQVPIPARGSGFDGDDRQQVNALVRSEAGRTAAAVAAGNILTSFLGDGATSARSAENAAAVITELGEQLQDGEYAPAPREAPAVTQTESGLAVVQQPQPEPVTDYELPTEYAAYFAEDEPDDDEPVEEPPPAAATVELDDDDLADPRIAAMNAENTRLRKQADHERKLRIKSARPAWEAEAKQVFRLGDTPLLTDGDIAGIKADSKREFIRQARAKADERKAWLVEAGVSTTQAAPAPTPQQKQQEWGPPPASPPPADLERNDREGRLARARQSGRLSNVIREMIS